MNSSSLRTAKPGDEATDEQQREAAWLQTEVEQRRAEVDILTRSLSEVSTEEAELVEQLRSLKYALELTRGEVERRTRGNTELHFAYAESAAAAAAAQSSSSQHHDRGATHPENTTPATTTTQPSATTAEGHDDVGKDVASEKHGKVQSLEAELLNAKRDVANVVYEIETLQIRYKQLTEMERLQKHNQATTAAVAAAASTSTPTGGTTAAIGASHNVNNSNSNVTASSPKPSLYSMAVPMTMSMPYPSSPLPLPTSTSNNNITTTTVKTTTGSPPLDSKNPPTPSNSTVSPTTSRSARLIADVDALIGFEFAYAPCRLGMQANGQMAIYSYSSPSPLLIIDDILDRHVEKLSAADALALGDRLRAVRVHTVERSSPFQQKQKQQPSNNDVDDVDKQPTRTPGQAVQTLCGLAEAVRAATQLMEDSKHAIHTGERRT